jgi:uncharacterized protein (DUF302 family)
MKVNDSTSSPPGLVTIRSPHSFSETVARLQSAFQTHGIKVFATIDQQAEAAAAGMTMHPTVLIIFGNPKAGTSLMATRPLSAIDLPLKVLVSEATAGEVFVAFNTAQYLAERHSLPKDLVGNIAPAERLIKTAVAGLELDLPPPKRLARETQ